MDRAPLCEPVRLAPGAALRVETVALGPESPANARLNHFHDLAEIVLFERIGGQLILGETPIELSDGMVVYIPPLAYHDFALAPGAKAWRLLQFDPTLKRGGVTVPTAPVAARPGAPAWTALIALSDWLADGAATTPGAAAGLETVLWIIRDLPQLEAAQGVEGPERFRALVARLQDDPRSAPDLTGAATRCALSPAYFSRRFQAAFGVGYAAYVEGLRLNRAARRLLEEAAPVSSIGYEVGFESPSYFTERFRRRFGTTPSEFRARAER
ncbi:helix-turn-helix transcriptional regulator [Brevundimonas subvibrioides]|uniref:helix-turn-helix transcriptional regulator n=1 Tax=Brevundimonas subvibrioides TaxID=74313 RepID=UPI0022B54E24|nr:AraC family transcriptional regulator [Brevundimonas subvibrioides]